MIKKIIVGLLIRLLDSSLRINYKSIDKKAFEQWAFDSFKNKGFESYLAYEDLKIMKEMSFGKGPWDYALLCGRRLQLLYMADEMRKCAEFRKSEAEKKQADNNNVST